MCSHVAALLLLMYSRDNFEVQLEHIDNIVINLNLNINRNRNLNINRNRKPLILGVPQN